jgi:hypothetical protein
VTHSDDEQLDQPTVSTAPPPARRRIPAHLGPARTSTVILAVLWLALGVLYLNVRPPTPQAASGGGTTVQTTEPVRTTTAPPATSTAPVPTTAEPTTASEVPTSTPPTESVPPTEESTEPTETTEPGLPPATSAPPPTTAATPPTG